MVIRRELVQCLWYHYRSRRECKRNWIKYKKSLDLHRGVKLENGSEIRVQMHIKTDFGASLSMSVNDNKILMAAQLLKEREGAYDKGAV